MKRNMDLIRELLIAVEQEDFTEVAIKPADADEGWGHPIPPFTEETHEHMVLLVESGYVKQYQPEQEGDLYNVNLDPQVALTMEGHNFLDLIRDKGVWDKIKNNPLADGFFSSNGAIGAKLLYNQLAEQFGLPQVA